MANTIEYYFSKGFDQKAAEYFAKGRKKVVEAVPNNDFTLLLLFNNGEKRLYDMRPFLKKVRSLSHSLILRTLSVFMLMITLV